MSELFDEMQRRYREGDTPWDDAMPPPEVQTYAETSVPGRALDLGCGTGRAGVFLAQRGWQCDGVDFVPEAIAAAKARAEAAGVADRARFWLTPVTRLGALHGPYDLALDVGCLHAQRGADLLAYAQGLGRLLRPGGAYLLFARILGPDEPDEGRGLREQTIRDLFAPLCVVERVAYGQSSSGAEPWASAWFWMRRAVA